MTGGDITALANDIETINIPSLAELNSWIKSYGFTRKKAKELSTQIRRKHILLYSRSKPRGYSFNIRFKTGEALNEKLKSFLKDVERKPKKKSSTSGGLLTIDQVKIKKPKKAKIVEVCPQCANDMQLRNMRLGPQQHLEVNYCNLCHFYVPV